MIRKTSFKDAERIHKIASENYLNTKLKQKGGFLVSKYSFQEYQSYIKKLNHFYVIENHGGVTMVNVKSAKNKKTFQKSPTENVLIGLPYIITLLWLILFFVAIILL